MAATSPYTPNDYTAVSNFRPYELPINDIFKAISAQNQFWDAGAARVKSVYDNALNLKLSLEPNKEIRKKYLEDAEKQLTKLSSMDLSDPSVQRQGFALFKPLFQDEGIIFDDLTTRHYDKVRNDAAMYKTKDNGKGYSDINVQYAMQGYNEFINSKDRMAGKAFYQSRKEYTPYYDYTEDFSKSLKDCKPSSIEATSPNYNGKAMSGYMKESYSKSLSAAQARGCLEAGLSTNAKRQLEIEGSVLYKNNIGVLASDTAEYLSGVSGNLSAKLQQLAATKAAIMSRKDLAQSEKDAAIAALDADLQNTTGELDKNNHAVAKINSGDYTDIQNNYDTYAGSIYSYKKLLKKATASAFEERRENYKADPVQLSAIKFTQDKYLRQMDFNFDVSLLGMKQQHDSEMKLLDLMYGGTGKDGATFKGADIYRNPLTGEVTVNPNLLKETPNLNEKPEINERIYEEITNQAAALNEQDQNNNLRLYNNFVARGERDKAFRETILKGFNYGTTDDEWARFKTESKNNRFAIHAKNGAQGGIQETSWFKAYTQGKPDDEDVNKWTYDNTVIETGIQVLNRKMELGEKQVQAELGGNREEQITKSIAKIKPVVVDGITVTPQAIADALLGKQGVVTVRKGQTWFDNEGNMHEGGNQYFINGKPLDSSYFTTSGGGQTPFNQMRSSVESATGSVINKINQKRVDVYNRLGFDREPWYFTPNDKAPLVQTLKSVLPKDEKGKDMDVSIIASDFSGGIRVSVPGVRKGQDTHLQALRDAGIGTSVEATGDNIVTIRGTNYNLVQQALQNPILAQAAYQLASIGETTSFNQTQSGAKVPNSDIQIPVMIRGKMQKMTIETFKNDNRPEYRVFMEGATDPRPLIVADNAYELFEKIGRSPVDLNKPVTNARPTALSNIRQ
jgi:hypothetical protein